MFVSWFQDYPLQFGCAHKVAFSDAAYHSTVHGGVLEFDEILAMREMMATTMQTTVASTTCC